MRLRKAEAKAKASSFALDSSDYGGQGGEVDKVDKVYKVHKRSFTGRL